MGLVYLEPEPLCATKPQGLSLLSDLHIGASTVDYPKIDSDVALAKRRKDRILINGDVFDAILPGDHKRFQPSVLHPRLHGCDDVLGEAVRWAAEILSPVARQIDMIGSGNHETAVAKHHSYDPIARLIELLSTKPGVHIAHGGYTGVVKYTFKSTSAKRSSPQPGFVVGYWHGSGGGASLSSSMGELGTKGSFLEGLDLLWFAHKHVRMASQIQRLSVSQKQARNVWLVRTGSYMQSYAFEKPTHGWSSRKVGSYATDALHHPYGLGGMRVVLTPTPKGVLSRVEME